MVFRYRVGVSDAAKSRGSFSEASPRPRLDFKFPAGRFALPELAAKFRFWFEANGARRPHRNGHTRASSCYRVIRRFKSEGIAVRAGTTAVRAQARNREGSRSPVAANFRMLAATILRLESACSSGRSDAQASSKTSRNSSMVSGSNAPPSAVFMTRPPRRALPPLEIYFAL